MEDLHHLYILPLRVVFCTTQFWKKTEIQDNNWCLCSIYKGKSYKQMMEESIDITIGRRLLQHHRELKKNMFVFIGLPSTPNISCPMCFFIVKFYRSWMLTVVKVFKFAFLEGVGTTFIVITKIDKKTPRMLLGNVLLFHSIMKCIQYFEKMRKVWTIDSLTWRFRNDITKIICTLWRKKMWAK